MDGGHCAGDDCSCGRSSAPEEHPAPDMGIGALK